MEDMRKAIIDEAVQERWYRERLPVPYQPKGPTSFCFVQSFIVHLFGPCLFMGLLCSATSSKSLRPSWTRRVRNLLLSVMDNVQL